MWESCRQMTRATKIARVVEEIGQSQSTTHRRRFSLTSGRLFLLGRLHPHTKARKQHSRTSEFSLAQNPLLGFYSKRYLDHKRRFIFRPAKGFCCTARKRSVRVTTCLCGVPFSNGDLLLVRGARNKTTMGTLFSKTVSFHTRAIRRNSSLCERLGYAYVVVTC